MSGNEPGSAVDAMMSGIAGDVVLDGLRAEPLLVAKPERQTMPFIFASPHSGRLYPASFARQSRLDPVPLRNSGAAFVGGLFAARPSRGAPLLAARFPRAFGAVNRVRGEIVPAMFDAPL